jgi:leucyl-tRNA synthetase
VCGAVPVPEDQLPVRLPEDVDFTPAGDGRSPLAQVAGWVNVPCPSCGGPAQRETDTMDGFACSSWYFLRFASPHEGERPFDPEAVRAWLPVDSYIGGAEHAVMHLLYARFWTKVIADAGLIDFDEPFSRLRNQGMLLSAADGQKMSKSRGNVVTPDEVAGRFGVDALRAYILFLGPFDADVVWDDRGIIGIARFLERYWTTARQIAGAPGDSRPFDDAFERSRNGVIRRVTGDMERFRFNTVVSALMEFHNELAAATGVGARQRREALRTLTLLLAPIVPFVTEEVWRTLLGEHGSVHRASWPVFDTAKLETETVTIVVQVDGKLRDRVTLPTGSDDERLREAALESARVQAALEGRQVVETVVVPGRLVNVVTRRLAE